MKSLIFYFVMLLFLTNVYSKLMHSVSLNNQKTLSKREYTYDLNAQGPSPPPSSSSSSPNTNSNSQNQGPSLLPSSSSSSSNKNSQTQNTDSPPSPPSSYSSNSNLNTNTQTQHTESPPSPPSSSSSSSSNSDSQTDSKTDSKTDDSDKDKDSKPSFSNYAQKNKDRDRKSPRGPLKRDDFNEIPFVKENQKLTNHSLVYTDASRLFALNFTYPFPFTQPFQTFTTTRKNFNIVTSHYYYFNVAYDLARIKITATFPQAGVFANSGLSIIGLYLDDNLIGASTLGVDTPGIPNRPNQLVLEPIIVKGSVFNVRPRTHKISLGIKTTSSPYIGDRTKDYTDPVTANNMNNIEQRLPMFVNLSIEGEVLRYHHY